MRKLNVISILFISGIILVVSGSWVPNATPSPEKQVERFISAVQKKDFKTIFDPKVLWQKLTNEYYESKKNAFLKEDRVSLEKAVERFGESMFGFLTDPVEHIKALTSILKESSKWKILKTKREKHLDRFHGHE